MADDDKTAAGPTSSTPPKRRPRPAATIDLAATEVGAPTDAAGSPPPRSGSPRPVFWPFAGAVLAGAVIVLAAVGVLWQFGFIAMRDSAVAELSPRRVPLDLQPPSVFAQPAQPAADSRALADMSARLAKIEAALAALPASARDPAVADRLAAMESASKSLADRVASFSQRVDATAKALDDIAQADADRPQTPAIGKSDMDKLADRIASLESSVKSAQDRPAPQAPIAAADHAVRFAVLAAALKTAVEHGDPFGPELAAIKPLAPDDKALAALAPFAATGTPTTAALGTELAGLIPSMSRIAEAPTRDGGILERLQSHAGRLVRIRPLDEPQGDDAADVIARVEIKAIHADIGGALTELAKLPPPVRAPAENWIAKAKARDAAVTAAQGLSTQALQALGKSAT